MSHAALPNIVLGREVVPEFLGWRRATPAALAAAAARLLNVGRTRQMLLCSTRHLSGGCHSEGFHMRWMIWRAVSARSETGMIAFARRIMSLEDAMLLKKQGFYMRWMTWRAVSARSETGVLTMAAVASGRWRPTTRSDPLYLKKLRGRSRETYVVEF